MTAQRGYRWVGTRVVFGALCALTLGYIATSSGQLGLVETVASTASEKLRFPWSAPVAVATPPVLAANAAHEGALPTPGTAMSNALLDNPPAEADGALIIGTKPDQRDGADSTKLERAYPQADREAQIAAGAAARDNELLPYRHGSDVQSRRVDEPLADAQSSRTSSESRNQTPAIADSTPPIMAKTAAARSDDPEADGTASLTNAAAAGRKQALQHTPVSGHEAPGGEAAFFPASARASTSAAAPAADHAPVRPPSLEAAYACLRQTFPDVKLEYPSDAEKHALEIHNAMAPWLCDEPHSAAGFSGPWIENAWIARYDLASITKNNGTLRDHFGPYVPLLIPWTDRWVQGGHSYPTDMVEALRMVLRPNVPYITVVQNAEGLVGHCNEGINHADIPNLLVLSAGGYGHVPVPLIKQPEEPLRDIAAADARYLVSFLGSNRTSWVRESMCEHVKNLSAGAVPENSDVLPMKFATVLCKRERDWRRIMGSSRASLCPRGFGRTSYRLAETIQMGLIPIYVYDDVPWVPYGELLFKNVGWMTHIAGLPGVLRELYELPTEEVDARRRRVLAIRDSHYVMPRIMDQISLFMLGDDGDGERSGGDLRCTRLPDCPKSNLHGCSKACRWDRPAKTWFGVDVTRARG